MRPNYLGKHPPLIGGQGPWRVGGQGPDGGLGMRGPHGPQYRTGSHPPRPGKHGEQLGPHLGVQLGSHG